jgi:hypothetical protein
LKASQAITLEKQADATIHVAGFTLRAVRVADKIKIKFVVIGKIIDGDADHGKGLGNMGELHKRETATAVVNEDARLQCVRFKAARFFQSRLRVNSLESFDGERVEGWKL